MISIATLKAMAAAGATIELVIATLEAVAADRSRALARARKQKQRDISVTKRDSHVLSRKSHAPVTLAQLNQCDTGNPGAPVPEAALSLDKDKKDKERKKERAAARKHALPDDWRPSNSLTLKGEEELAKMRDWARANAINKADWAAMWSSWTRRVGGGCETVSPQLVVSNDGYAAFGSREMEAWEAHERATGKSYPRDKRGGWTFPSRWPPQAACSGPLDERQPNVRADTG